MLIEILVVEMINCKLKHSVNIQELIEVIIEIDDYNRNTLNLGVRRLMYNLGI